MLHLFLQELDSDEAGFARYVQPLSILHLIDQEIPDVPTWQEFLYKVDSDAVDIWHTAHEPPNDRNCPRIAKSESMQP